MDIRVQLQLERALLGSAIARCVEEREASAYFAGFINPAWFTHPPHQMIADAIIHCAKTGLSPNIPTLEVILASRKQLSDELSLCLALSQSASLTESIVSVEHYGTLLRDAYLATIIKERCLKIADEADAYTPGAIEILELSARGICDGLTNCGKMFHSMGEIDETLANPNSIPSYIPSLNSILVCGGFPSGEYSYIMAPRGTGKSSIMISEATHASMVLGKKVIYATLEMSKEQIKNRVMRNLTGLDFPPFRDDLKRWYDDKRRELQDTGFEIMSCTGDLTVWERFRAEISRRCKSERIDFVVIDYIQRFSTSRYSRNSSRTDDLDYIANDLKSTCSELDIPVFTAAQPVQHLQAEAAVEFRTKHAMAIEEHAALVWTLLKTPEGNVDSVITKNRYGQSFVKLKLLWDNQFVAYKDATVP